MRLLSPNAALILGTFLRSPTTPRYGYELLRDSGIKSGSLYPILGRFEKLGWIRGSVESSPGGRPPRRVYEMTVEGVEPAQAALDRFFAEKQVPQSERISWGLG